LQSGPHLQATHAHALVVHTPQNFANAAGAKRLPHVHASTAFTAIFFACVFRALFPMPKATGAAII
jgi:hypothetical protein